SKSSRWRPWSRTIGLGRLRSPCKSTVRSIWIHETIFPIFRRRFFREKGELSYGRRVTDKEGISMRLASTLMLTFFASPLLGQSDAAKTKAPDLTLLRKLEPVFALEQTLPDPSCKWVHVHTGPAGSEDHVVRGWLLKDTLDHVYILGADGATQGLARPDRDEIRPIAPDPNNEAKVWRLTEEDFASDG